MDENKGTDYASLAKQQLIGAGMVKEYQKRTLMLMEAQIYASLAVVDRLDRLEASLAVAEPKSMEE